MRNEIPLLPPRSDDRAPGKQLETNVQTPLETTGVGVRVTRVMYFVSSRLASLQRETLVANFAQRLRNFVESMQKLASKLYSAEHHVPFLLSLSPPAAPPRFLPTNGPIHRESLFLLTLEHNARCTQHSSGLLRAFRSKQHCVVWPPSRLLSLGRAATLDQPRRARK